MKQKIVGIYYAGYEQVELVLREGDGGEFYTIPEGRKNKVPRINVGADCDTWEQFIGILMHELQEFLLFRLRSRYLPSDDTSRDHSSYIFLLNHNEFSELCQRTAECLTSSWDDLKTAWAEWRKTNEPS